MKGCESGETYKETISGTVYESKMQIDMKILLQ